MSTLIFLHGLNTYGDDQLHVGPLAFGPMHARLEEQLEKNPATNRPHFVPILDLSTGAPEVEAKAILARHPSLFSQSSDLILLGHSTGGLIARALASQRELCGRVRAVITISTPHLGAEAADLGLRFPEQHRFLNRVLPLFGYDPRAKAKIFDHFTTEALAQFNRSFPPIEGIRYVSLICEVKPDELSWPLRPLYPELHHHLAPRARGSDGFVSTFSQRWGECVGPFRLDHFGSLGFFPYLPLFSGAEKKLARAEFVRMVDSLGLIVGV